MDTNTTLFLYYLIKPFLPRRLQIGLRRIRARRVLALSGSIWPIDMGSGKVPNEWKSWPNEKAFAVVLTHDVEGVRGLSRVSPVTALERSLGFRSCVNFVGGDYTVPDALRAELLESGFEIGVHGFHHNGLMYLTRRLFLRHAKGINACLEKWSATGFRSPAMHRNLEWLHDLRIRYDSSTFDTDPFEPQPEGIGTIFPVWVTDWSGTKAYLELPYTLPQDFTLYTILQERSNDIWKRKVDWIAANGGMALVNTHPDYTCFEGERQRHDEYPVSFYRDFLTYLGSKYAGQYWNALPVEIVDFWESIYPAANELNRVRKALRPRLRVCMLTYSFYEMDNRVRRYAETLARRGDEVDVLCLGQDGAVKHEVIQGVHVYRLRSRIRDEKGALDYLRRTLRFLLRSGWELAKSWRHKRYDLVHAHNIPDFEVFAALPPRLRGASVILDIHDVVPELFCTKFNRREGSPLFRILCGMERWACRFADHVIISNDLWRERVIGRSVPPEKCSVFLNYPDPSLFSQRVATCSTQSKRVVIYPGSLNEHQGLELAIRAFATVSERVPDSEFRIYGEGAARERLERLAGKLKLDGRVVFKNWVPLDQMGAIMAGATCGVVPKRGDGFGNEAFSTKILEFMTVGVPILVARTRIDAYYFDDSVVAFFEPGNVVDLEEKMTRLLLDDVWRSNLAERAKVFVHGFSWDLKKQAYIDLVDGLVAEKRAGRGEIGWNWSGRALRKHGGES